jgi:serine/threonine-protein kinase
MSTPSDNSATKAEGTREPKSTRPPGGPEALVGVVLSGRYLIERLIGEGGMGAVYQAEHTHMRKRMAVKVLHPEMSRMPEVVARFEREAMAAAHIDHPNVASATDFGKLEDGSFFLVLEFVEGQSLRDAMAGGQLELGRAIHIARQIASGLARAHALGIVHRDLKPENVMLVSRDGDPDFVKVLDFGIAKVPVGDIVGEQKEPGQVLTQLGMVYGTPEYMAPEQALGQAVDPRADLYALGVMTFEMLVGKRPYDHESKVALLGMHVTAPIPSMAARAPDANIPTEIDAIVMRLLSKEAGARFVDARELVEALDTLAIQLAAEGRIAEPAVPMSISRSSDGRSPALPEPGRKLSKSVPDGAGQRSAAIAVAPTGLAQPVTAIPSRILARLNFARLNTVLSSALSSAPPWVTPKVVVAAAGSIVLLLLVLIVTIASGSRGARAGGPRAASSEHYEAPVYPPNPKIDEVMAAAQNDVNRGNYASAIDAVTPLEKSAPDRADVHALLEHAHMGTHDTRAALREAGLWLAADPRGAADSKLEEDVRNAALVRDVQDDAFALLESRMGPEGIDILYDLAYGASGRLYPQAAARAKRSLDAEEVRDQASPGLRVLLGMRDAKKCEQKRDLLNEARDSGDARLLPVLQGFESTRGCGFLGRSDCNPCLRRDHALREAIEAIEERSGK